MALAAIFRVMSEEMMVLVVVERETAKEAWETLRMMHLSEDCVKEACVQNLRSEYENLRMKDNESVDNFAMSLTLVANKIRGLGDKMEEVYVVRKFLYAVPGKFVPVVTTLEQFGDLKAMKVEELIGCLKTHEEGAHRFGGGEVEQLLLTRAEWEAKTVSKDGEQSSSNIKPKDKGGRCWCSGCWRERDHGGRSHGEHGNEERTTEPGKKKFDKTKIRCYNCHNLGHFTSECRSKEDKGFVAEKDDDGPVLLMVEACELSRRIREGSMEVMLNEETSNLSM